MTILDRFRLDDRVVIVTGASSGQGAAEARLCAAEGAHVVLTDINPDGQQIAEECGGTFIRHDVSASGDWEAVVQATI